MKICGLQKTTLLDFPGKVAATVFLGGCNFRCPFCHNSDLLTGSAPNLLSEEELLRFLEKRSGILEGVCITGGEPTLYPRELARLMKDIRSLGYKIKLDTNGYLPHVLRELCDAGLVDFVAMDIKAGRDHYSRASGVPEIRVESVSESADYLMRGKTPYEFRTTVVKGLHTKDDFTDIAQWLKGCRQYFLQGFVDSGNIPEQGFSAYSRAELEHFLSIVRETIPRAEIRGVDY